MVRRVSCRIKGISPLLMHRFPMAGAENIEKKPAEEQAELVTYRDPDTGELFIPGAAFQRALVSAATYSKGKGRASMQKPVAACVLVVQERSGLGVREYAIDSRMAVNPVTKGHILRHRPRLEEWAATFEMDYDPELVTETQLRQIVDDCGSRVGLLDFRPERKGPFGRFMVTEWKTI